MEKVNSDQLKLFREADWGKLQVDLVKYAEAKVRPKKWRSGAFLPKGLEVPDLVASCIMKTMNVILGEEEDPSGKSTWNQQRTPQLIDHLKGAIDSEVANLVRSREHKKTNYSPGLSPEEAQQAFAASVDAANAESVEEDESIRLANFEEFKVRLLDHLQADVKATALVNVYWELSHTHDVVKPMDAAKKLGLPIEEVRNLVKKVRRAADHVSEAMELEYAK